MQINKSLSRHHFAPLRFRPKASLKKVLPSTSLLDKSSLIPRQMTKQTLSRISLRIKSASNSRYNSPGVSLSQSMAQDKSICKPKSENVTPKRLALREDAKKAGHKRNLSLEFKLNSMQKSASEVKLPAKNTRSSSSLNVSPMKSTGEVDDLAMEREEIIQYLDEYYRLRKCFPVTTSFYYKFLRVIGKGAFGKVSLAVHKLTGRYVAVKSIDKAYLKEERAQLKVLQEVANMHSIHDLHVVRLLEVFESTRHFNMVMEYCSGGDLLQHVKSKGKLEEEEAQGIFIQVVQAVKACHDRSVIHRDVKLDNVLLSSTSPIIKLCDFGVSRFLHPNQRITDQCGTPAYLAPEIIANQGYDGFYVDLWSLGVLLYAMLVGAVPFRAASLPELHKVILRGKYAGLDTMSREARDLIDALLQLVPQKRLGLDAILRHSWLAGYRGNARFQGGHLEARDSVNREVLEKVKKLGLPRDFIERCLRENTINHGTATYEVVRLEMEERLLDTLPCPHYAL